MPTLFDTTLINGMTLRNRLVRSATWEGLSDSDGLVTDSLVEFYGDLARGGVGLIVSGYLHVRRDGRQNAGQVGADSDACVSGLARIVDAVHAEGGAIAAQLVHCGGQVRRDANGDQPTVAPSAVESPGYPEVPLALSEAGIDALIAAFAAAARRAVEAGFDAVQLHGAHGYLLASFLSPLRNRRTDRYGGSLANRCRFAMACYHAVRDAVGPDVPVMIKLNGSDVWEGSTTEADASVLAAMLADAGIDAIEVSGGTPGSGRLGPVRGGIEGPMDEAYFLPHARAIRAAAPEVPLMLVGGLRSLERIEPLIEAGEVDYVAMSRPLIREPGLPARWASGDGAPSSCFSCSRCFGPAKKGDGIQCVRLDEDGYGAHVS